VGELNDIIPHDPAGVVATACLQREMALNTGSPMRWRGVTFNRTPYVERLIGSIRRESLNHVIVFHEAHLRPVLSRYFDYYHNSRTHRALDDNAPNPRVVEPPGRGRVEGVPQVGGFTVASPAWRRLVQVQHTASRRTDESERPGGRAKTESLFLFPSVLNRIRGLDAFAFAPQGVAHRSFWCRSCRPTWFSGSTGFGANPLC
jgi:Integrase core domain